jgi:hypothetical protein
LYGKLRFDKDFSTGKSIEIYFVLDESGDVPWVEEDKEENSSKKDGEGTSQPADHSANADNAAKKPAKSEAKLSRYDRLYIDLNRDLDLTNDPVVMPRKDQALLRNQECREARAFEFIDISVDYGPGLGVRPFQCFPYFRIYEDDKQKEYPWMHLAATVARQGRIQIGAHQYDALLAQPFLISGRFDRHTTSLFLKPLDPKEKVVNGWVTDILSAVRVVDGAIYTTVATPLGDKLTVRRYDGDFGVLSIGPGNRDVSEVSFRGSLESKDMALDLTAVASASVEGEDTAKEFRVPVGDYYPSWMTVKLGRLKVNLSDNYHSDGRVRSWDQPRTHFIQIRKDKPFVLDFSNKPDVLFASPAKGMTFKRGDEVSVKAVLIDPACDFMIREILDTSQKQKKTFKDDDGTEHSYEQALSLDPIVTITDSSGKKVSEGPMPFG